MEFFRELTISCTAEQLQSTLTIEDLPLYCSEIDKLLCVDGDEGEIYCLWGAFRVRRESINGSVRFTMPGCPNALAWTITAGLPPKPESTVVHCTINRQEHEQDFIDSIETFVDALAQGLLASIGLIKTAAQGGGDKSR